MNIYTHIPYTYLIGWSHHNKYYYGVQFGKNANPANLWTTYFTSSKAVKKFREQYGEPDVIQVRKCFHSKDTAIEWESKTLKRIKSKAVFLNRTFGTVKGYKHTFTAETKAKLSKSFMDNYEYRCSLVRGKNNPMYGRNRSGENNPRYGAHVSDETKRLISDKAKGKIVAKDVDGNFVKVTYDEFNRRDDLVHSNTGRHASDETKKKMSESKKQAGIKPPSPKGKLWWNKDGKNFRSEECPGEGWFRGRVKWLAAS